MARPRSGKESLSPEEFVNQYVEAYKHGLGPQEFADSIGIGVMSIYGRTSRYRKLGIDLPYLGDNTGYRPNSITSEEIGKMKRIVDAG